MCSSDVYEQRTKLQRSDQTTYPAHMTVDSVDSFDGVAPFLNLGAALDHYVGNVVEGLEGDSEQGRQFPRKRLLTTDDDGWPQAFTMTIHLTLQIYDHHDHQRWW